MQTADGPNRLIVTVNSLVPQTQNTTLRKEHGLSQIEGTVRWFNNAKGYGFLGRNDGGKDAFIHFSSIQSEGYKTLKEGQAVTFEVVDGGKGPQADQVKVVKNSRAGSLAEAL